MFNFTFFSPVNRDLAVAAYLLVIEFAVGFALAYALGQLGMAVEPVFIGLSLSNLSVAWYLAKAARALGKNRWLYGAMAALNPGLALFAYSRLRQHELLTWLDRN